MNKVLNNSFLKYIALFLIFVVFAKGISLIALYFLPKSGVTALNEGANNITFRSYKPSRILGLSAQKVSNAQTKKDNLLQIDNLTLHAIYGNSEQGFIVFAKKSSPNQNHILALKKSYEGYKLVQIRLQSVVFEKAGKEYELVLKRPKNYIVRTVPHRNERKNGSNVTRSVNRQDVVYYAKNFNEIWKNIAIKEVKRGGVLSGFKVLRIKSGTVFSRLGLSQGDVIVGVNNQPLKSYADAFKIYDNIDSYDALKITVIRNNQKKELEYELN